jgi:hypothetical protein
VGEVPSTLPRASSASTATYAAAVIVVLVSKFVSVTVLVGRSAVVLVPLSTRQAATPVAPFQLA